MTTRPSTQIALRASVRPPAIDKTEARNAPVEVIDAAERSGETVVMACFGPDGIALRHCGPLRAGQGPRQVKLVVFVPEKDLGPVNDKRFTTGARAPDG